ncbi:hypothetical protein ACUN7V_13495 [Quadrisphaera oryzae]|uniref:hypothetical protein n=1 Tax=Quadrisphaera TaxID=317661 RepID=UPI0016462B14|nr:hypothetical protein [Quadrisphaera sp. RL12-1S]MBC3760135.1 hypothetical protein [Quadrisphaera sp. RL12-1S]
MHPASLLPPELADRPFRVSEALALGVTPKRLRSADLWAPFRGVRAPVSLGWSPLLRARAGLLVCPPGTSVVGLHAVAAAGLVLPYGFEAVLADEPLLVRVPLSTWHWNWSRVGFAVDPAPLPATVPRVTDDGARRPADAHLWARVVAWPSPRLHRLRHRPYALTLGAQVVERLGGDLAPLQDAVLVLPQGVRHRLVPLIAELARTTARTVEDGGSGRR